MRTTKRLFCSTLALGLLLLVSCKTTKTNAPFYNYKTVCTKSNLDGTIQVKAWGKGQSEKAALEQAKTTALKEILFSGFPLGPDNCQRSPLIPEVNAGKKYETYFITFFKNEYSEYVSVLEETTPEGKNTEGYLMATTLTIKLADLKQRLFDDGIIR